MAMLFPSSSSSSSSFFLFFLSASFSSSSASVSPLSSSSFCLILLLLSYLMILIIICFFLFLSLLSFSNFFFLLSLCFLFPLLFHFSFLSLPLLVLKRCDCVVLSIVSRAALSAIMFQLKSSDQVHFSRSCIGSCFSTQLPPLALDRSTRTLGKFCAGCLSHGSHFSLTCCASAIL